MKRLRRYYRHQLSHSVTLKGWNSEDSKVLLEYYKYPSEVNDAVNIVKTLECHFDIPRAKAIKLAMAIRKKHKKTIKDYMYNWFDIGRVEQRLKVINKGQALKEQIARGFILKSLANLDPTLPYIKSNIGTYVYPKQWPPKQYQNLCGIYEKLGKVGVQGYTGVVIPRNLMGK